MFCFSLFIQCCRDMLQQFGRHWSCIYVQKQPPELFCNKFVLKNFAMFTTKQLFWRFFSIKLQLFRSVHISCECWDIFRNNYFEEYRPEAVAQRCSAKKLFLEISQNSQKNICARASFLIVCLKSFIIAKQK